MNKFALYVRYALRSFIRGRSRSLFGAFCVSVGVASVVALGMAGSNFQSAMTGSAQKQNRGDISVSPPGQSLTLHQYAMFAQLKAQGHITDFTPRLQDDAILRSTGSDRTSTIGSFTAVDPSKFPFYDTITAVQPSGTPLAKLLTHPNDAVVGQDVFNTLHLTIGGRFAVDSRQGFSHVYTVRGIVPDNAPDTGFGAGINNDFAMVNQASAVPFFHGLDIGATVVYVKTRDQVQAAAAKKELLRRLGGLNTVKTVADVEKDSKSNAESFNKFFRVMGLTAVLIGGIGIINTMLVAARRRTKEIAVLKAVGMKGREVVLVFTIESLILAIAGTVLGVALGLLASIAVNNVTESLAGYPLPWSLHMGPILAGVAVGLVATVLFAYLPVLSASKARPVAALRSETVGLPKQGRIRMVLLVLGLSAVMGCLAVFYTGIVSGAQVLVYGVIAGIGALAVAGLLTQFFVLVVWLISKLPSMGRLSARMAFRNMGTQKRRLGSTLLALCIGILSVGTSAIMAQNLKTALAGAINHQQKLNVVVQSSHDPRTIQHLNAVVGKLPGIQHKDYGAVAGAAILARVAGHNTVAITQQALRSHRVSRDTILQAASKIRGVEGRDLRVARYSLSVSAGRNLSKADAGTDHLVVNDDLATVLNIKVGSHVAFQDGARMVPFTVIGLTKSGDPSNFSVFASNEADLSYLRRVGLTSPSSSHLSELYLQIKDDALQSNISGLRRALPHAQVLDLGKFLTLFNKTIDKLVLFPEIIAALSLFAGAVIIANTVALAMLERRREIGVMKAVGAKRRSIVAFLMVEYGTIGFLGALVGVLLAMLATFLVDELFLKISPSFDVVTIVGLLLLGTVLAIGASSLTALPASSEKPMNVLRYE